VTARYAASDGYVAYRWRRLESGVEIHVTGSGERIHLRVPLPEHVTVPSLVMLNAVPQDYAIEDANGSRYVVFDLTAPFGKVQVLWATGSLQPIRLG